MSMTSGSKSPCLTSWKALFRLSSYSAATRWPDLIFFAIQVFHDTFAPQGSRRKSGRNHYSSRKEHPGKNETARRDSLSRRGAIRAVQKSMECFASSGDNTFCRAHILVDVRLVCRQRSVGHAQGRHKISVPVGRQPAGVVCVVQIWLAHRSLQTNKNVKR